MSVFLLRAAATTLRVAAICHEHGLALSRDEPWTNGIVYGSWSDDHATVTLANDARSGAQLLRIDEDEARLTEVFSERLELETMAEVFEVVRTAREPLDRVRALYRAHAFRLIAGEPDELLVELQCEHLGDEDAWVRWAAVRLLSHRADRGVEAALAQAVEQYPELRGTLARVRSQCAAAEDGTLHDAPTESWDELIKRARAGLREGHATRAARAMDVLLEDCSDHTEGVLLRARAYATLGQPTLARALLGAAEASGRIEREMKEGKDLVMTEALLIEVAQARQDLPEEAAIDEDALLAWFERWSNEGRDTAACGAALAIIDEVPNLSAVLSFVAGRHRHDRRLLERAYERAPGSPWCIRALASAWKTDQPERAATLFEEALERIAAEDRSREEAIIDRLGAAFEASLLTGATSLEAGLLEDLTSLYYDERCWDDAIRYADRLVVANPTSTTAWQWRANARTFALRHEEAVHAYQDALTAIEDAFQSDGIVVGSDPRPGMRFNLACVLAKLGRHASALDELRRAVRAERKWGAEALTDDYFESLWEDETFARVVEGEAAALVLDEERSADFIGRLVDRGLSLCHRGNYAAAIEAAERATALAEMGELRELVVRALAVHARALAFGGDADLGVAKAVKARALADHEDISSKTRSELAHELGVVLHASGNHERAADAYQRALGLRKEAYGEHHAIIAKSLGDLARLASDRGEPTLDLYREGVELLERFLASEGQADDERDEARVDLAILQANLAESLRKSGDVEAALAALEPCVETIEEAVSARIPMAQPFVDHALDLGERLVRATSEQQRERARQLVDRLESLLAPGTPEQKRERSFWLRLRRFVRNTVRDGVPETTLARMLSEALRGGKKLPPPVRRIPEIAGLMKALAERATRYPALLAMAVMALSSAEANGNLDEALENLQELCVAALVDGTLTRR